MSVSSVVAPSPVARKLPFAPAALIDEPRRVRPQRVVEHRPVQRCRDALEKVLSAHDSAVWRDRIVPDACSVTRNSCMTLPLLRHGPAGPPARPAPTAAAPGLPTGASVQDTIVNRFIAPATPSHDGEWADAAEDAMRGRDGVLCGIWFHAVAEQSHAIVSSPRCSKARKARALNQSQGRWDLVNFIRIRGRAITCGGQATVSRTLSLAPILGAW